MLSFRSPLAVSFILAFACDGAKDDTGGGAGDGGVSDGGGADGGGSDGGASLTDEDADGYLSDVDCNDNDYTVHPDATEECDGIDQDCDGEIDEDFDADGDGHDNPTDCPETGDDCDDGDASISPSADEVPYDDIDQDCDGADLTDVDGDGFDAEEAGGADCDDTDASINPLAEEIAKDGIDQDCNGEDLFDDDGDGYNDIDFGGLDCDDTDASVYPDAPGEWMNDGIDQDCDGSDGEPLSLKDADIYIEGTSTAQSYAGETVVLCDLDEDGADDLIVTAPFHSSYAGQTGIWYGSGYASWTKAMALSTADTIFGADAGDFFGLNAICTDIDGDGHLDVVLQKGEIDYSTSYQSDFAIHLFYGDGAAFSSSLSLDDADAIFEATLGVQALKATVRSAPAHAADLDGDGASEMVFTFGHPEFSVYDYEERILILPGDAYSGTTDLTDEVSHVIAPDQTDQFGGDTPWYLSTMFVSEDFDGDGNNDIIVLSQEYDGDTGSTATDIGSIDWMSAMPSAGDDLLLDDLTEARITGSHSAQRLGYKAIAGDFDGDGDQDLIVSAAGNDDTDSINTGGIFLLSDVAADFAAAGGELADLADAWAYGSAKGSLLGYALASTGDIDGDGADDFLVSAPSPSYTSDTGTVFTSSGPGSVWLVSGALFTGEVTDLDDVCMMAWDDTASDHYTATSLSVGDIDGDGLTDFVFGSKNYGYATTSTGTTPGRAYVYLGSEL